MELDVVTALLDRFGPWGFLGVVTFWFMLRMEKKLDRLSDAMEKIAVTQAVLVRTLDAADGGPRAPLLLEDTGVVEEKGSTR